MILLLVDGWCRLNRFHQWMQSLCYEGRSSNSPYDFQEMGHEVLLLSARNTRYPPWLQPSEMLLKLVSGYITTLVLEMWRGGNVMWVLLSFVNLIILFAVSVSDMVASCIMELMLETWKLISGWLMFASHANCPMALLKLIISLSFNILWGSESSSLFSGMIFKLSAYLYWSMLINISSFCLMLMPFFISHMNDALNFPMTEFKFSCPYWAVNKQNGYPNNLLCLWKRKIPPSYLEGLAPSLPSS